MNNTTRSELSFVPTTEDDGKSITCRAENPKVTGLFLEKTWKLDVVCKFYLNYFIQRQLKTVLLHFIILFSLRQSHKHR